MADWSKPRFEVREDMFFRLLAAFIVIPLVELFLLLRLAEATSALTTFLVVLGTGILGTILARRQGLLVWVRFRSALAEGRMPSQEIQDGLMIVFAAALLLTPGLLTDTLGLLLLIPVTRNFVRTRILSRYVAGMNFRVVTSSGHTVDSSEDSPLEPGAAPRTEQLNRRGYTVDAKSFEPRH
jgi:UPF0716 protein FxsA